MFNRTFMLDAGVRIIRTFAQALIGALGLDGAGVIHGTWHQAIAVALSAALLSGLTQLASITGAELTGAVDADQADTPAPVALAKSEAPGPIINTETAG